MIERGIKINMINGLDEIDNKILQLLAENARASFVDIGKEVNLSRTAVKLRIQALESKGIIEKYSIIINPEKVGNTLAVFFDIEVNPIHLNEVCDILVENPYIIKMYQMTGNTSLHIHAMLESNEHLESFLKNVIYELPGIVNVRCSTIVSRIKDSKEIRI